ncbi:MAG: hypothetical protein RLW62_23700 [Gammaproteobacteria bacterium]
MSGVTLREIGTARREAGGLLRRWYRGATLDLFTWSDARGAIVQFQLCFDTHRHERTVSWNADTGVRAFDVDDGRDDAARRHPGSSLLVAGDMPDLGALRQAFLVAARGLEPHVREQVAGHLGAAATAPRAAAGTARPPVDAHARAAGWWQLPCALTAAAVVLAAVLALLVRAEL